MKTLAGLMAFCLIAGTAWASTAWAGPCDIITQKDAEAILGEAVKPGRESKIAGFAAGMSCRYFTAAPLSKRGRTGSVSVSIYDSATMKKEGGMYSSPQKYFNRMQEALSKQKNSKVQELAGLGDQAFWQGGSESLHLVHKGVYYVLSIKDMKQISSKKGIGDMHSKLAAHRLKLCEDAARKYILK